MKVLNPPTKLLAELLVPPAPDAMAAARRLLDGAADRELPAAMTILAVLRELRGSEKG